MRPIEMGDPIVVAGQKYRVRLMPAKCLLGLAQFPRKKVHEWLYLLDAPEWDDRTMLWRVTAALHWPVPDPPSIGVHRD